MDMSHKIRELSGIARGADLPSSKRFEPSKLIALEVMMLVNAKEDEGKYPKYREVLEAVKRGMEESRI